MKDAMKKLLAFLRGDLPPENPRLTETLVRASKKIAAKKSQKHNAPSAREAVTQ